MEKSKKIISLLLALIMTLSVFTIVPFSAGAAQADVSPVGAPESYTDIHVGDTLFPEFEDGVDTAYFKFIPEQDMPIIFTSRSSFGVTAYLYDAEMNQLAFSEESSYDLDRAGGFNFKIAYDVSAGNTYYFGVKYKSFSFFDVQLRELPEIRVGETAAAMFAKGGDYAYFKFVPEQDMTIDFTSLSDSDTYGYLYDADMNLLTYHENRRGSFDIVYDVTAGNTYYLCAYYSYGGSVNVQLTIKKDPEIKPTEPPTQSPTDAPTEPSTDAPTEPSTDVPAQVINSGTTGDCTWTLDDEGVLTISGNGAMADYYWSSTAPWGESITEVIIQDGVTNIGNYAFEYCEELTSVTIPDTVTSIGESAFTGCSGLTGVTIPDTVTSIGEYAFAGCSGLTSVAIPDSVTSIDRGTFAGCSGLTSVAIPDTVTSIGKKAFFGCTGLTSVTIPDSVTSIGYEAFKDCTGLTSVTIPDSVISIGDDAFYRCDVLTSVYITDIAAWCNIDFFSSTANPLFNNSLILPHNLYLNDELVTDLVIPDGVTSIDDYAFYGCTSITSVTIPDSVTSIDNEAFRNCTGLTSVTIPDSVTSIGRFAFDHSSGLTSVTIGNSVTSIGDMAFSNCASLSSITVGSGNKIYDSRNNCNAIIETDENELLFGCNSTVIPDSVTSIGEDAFHGCKGLTSVTIPDSVTSIEYKAFWDCKGLTSVTIGNGVTSIGEYAFEGCTGLTSVTIGNSVKSIDVRAFYGSEGLTSVTIPDSVTSIGDLALGYGMDYEKVVGFTIYGVKGSEAERYANDNEFMFVALGTPVELHDDTTDISVTLTDDVELSVADVTGSETTGNIQLVGEKIEKAYEIKLMNDGEAIQPSGEVTVKIPCDNENAKVYRVEADGSLTDMHAVYTDGYLVFTTDHFSVYIVAVDEPEANVLLGDVDGDGTISILDATAIQRVLADFAVKSFNEKAACVTGEDLSILDATMIQRYLADFATPYHIGDYVK